MSGKSDTPTMFGPNANATPISEIPPPAVDPRRARVHAVHQRIAKAVKDGSIYREPRKSR